MAHWNQQESPELRKSGSEGRNAVTREDHKQRSQRETFPLRLTEKTRMNLCFETPPQIDYDGDSGYAHRDSCLGTDGNLPRTPIGTFVHSSPEATTSWMRCPHQQNVQSGLIRHGKDGGEDAITSRTLQQV